MEISQPLSNTWDENNKGQMPKHLNLPIQPICRFAFVSVLFVLLGSVFWLEAESLTPPLFEITHYELLLEPDIASKTLRGSVALDVKLISKTESIELDCGELTVDQIHLGKAALKYAQQDHRLRIFLPPGTQRHKSQRINIEYHGAPKRGIRFFPERMQVYTVFSSSQWMVCLDDPSARATLRLRLIVPADLTTIGNGKFIGRKALSSGKAELEWREDRSVPSYTYGFAIGRFHKVTARHGATELDYFAEQYTEEQLRDIFKDTPDMVQFYEERSGIRYPGPSYTQVLAAGGVEQEMAGFTALKEKYGEAVLANERDVWLGAHELAHQWWGIGVGCEAWTHFWLNEGMATFMADAYKEHRFGRDEYLKEIENSRKVYEKVRDAGKDRSLVFPDWLHPSAEDRALVYDKGAYVLSLLREEMGEPAFWNGIRSYTRKYFGRSVTTADFQSAMQQASIKDLRPFFDKWVYLTKK